MTPKEKAKELVDRYYWTFGDGYLGEQHIQCALIAVDNLLEFMDKFDLDLEMPHQLQWWRQVKQEIEKL